MERGMHEAIEVLLLLSREERRSVRSHVHFLFIAHQFSPFVESRRRVSNIQIFKKQYVGS